MVEIMREVLAIGRAVGVDADIDPEQRIDMARALGPFKTSMLQDLEAGKPLEIDGLLAGTLEIARKAGVRGAVHRKPVRPHSRARRCHRAISMRFGLSLFLRCLHQGVRRRNTTVPRSTPACAYAKR